MGLDCYMIAVPKDTEPKDNEEVTQIAYWRKNWFIHEYLANIYHEQIDPTDTEFNCCYMPLDLDLLHSLHHEMCEEAYSQMQSFDDIPYYDAVTTDDIDELKKAISYVKDNPNQSFYYYGWY